MYITTNSIRVGRTNLGWYIKSYHVTVWGTTLEEVLRYLNLK